MTTPVVSSANRIFENIDERQYHQSIARKLKVRLYNNDDDDDDRETESEVQAYTQINQQQRSELEFELTPELKQAGIVERFAFYSETNAIHILLNHQYTRKSIVFSVDKKDWNKTHNVFEKQLKQKGISKEHILLLSDVLDNNYQAILSLGQNLQNQVMVNSNNRSNRNKKKKITNRSISGHMQPTSIQPNVTTHFMRPFY
jgi:hypothetical protein